jgi:hypothetical protein
VIRQIAMFKLSDYAEGEDKAKKVKEAKEQLESIRKNVRAMLRIECGINVSNWDRVYGLMSTSDF